jgi:hypothetical protein
MDDHPTEHPAGPERPPGRPGQPPGWPPPDQPPWGSPPAQPPSAPPAGQPPWSPPGQPPSGPPPGQPPPGPGAPAAPARGRRGLILALAAAGGLLLVAAVVVTVARVAGGGQGFERPLAAPSSVAELDRIDDPTLAGVVDQATAQFRRNGTEAVGAVYGPSLAQPRLFLVAVRDHLASGRVLLDRFARSAAPQAAFDPGSIRELERDGRRYDCTPVGGGQVSAACIWSDDDAFLITAAYGGTGVDQLTVWADDALDQLTR